MPKKAMTVRKLQQMSALEMSMALFAPSPILEGEDSEAFHELFKRVMEAIGPSDIIECIWVRDYVRCAWEVMRYRNAKERLIKAQVPRALEEILERLINAEIEEKGTDSQIIEMKVGIKPTPTERVVTAWLGGRPSSVTFVDELLRCAGLTMADVEARAMALAIDEISLVDRLSARVEQSRNAALREIDQWRAGFGRRLHEATQEVIEGEFNAIESEATSSQKGGEDGQ